MPRLRLAILLLLSATAARADDAQWSATLYAGPATTKYILAVLSSGSFQPTGAMAGLAVDRRHLVDLGWDITFGVEGQVTQTFFGQRDTTFALGPGLEAHEPFGWKGTSFSFYTGPSYATDPPATSIGYGGKIEPSGRKTWLNFVGVEFASRLAPDSDPANGNWDIVGRLYHRSGAWGLYAENTDAGMAVGIGIRKRF
jgi:hypothetical protein